MPPFGTSRSAGLPLGSVLEGTPYRLTAELARSEHAVVYRGEHVKLRTKVIVKALAATKSADPQQADRMRLEAQALARLRHPNLVAVIDSGVSHDRLFFVMDDDDERSLEATLGTGGRMAIEDALDLVDGLLDGLAFLHEHGLVHRDLNTENLLVSRDSTGARTLKILDLGAVKILGGHALHRLEGPAVPTADGLALGSPRGMSPEQISGGTVDARSDLYAVGCIVFRMVTGRDPFAHHSGAALVLAAHLNEAPPSTTVAAGARVVGPAVETVLRCALAKRPDERPASAQALRLALRAARADDGLPLERGGSSSSPAGALETRTRPFEQTLEFRGPGEDDTTTVAVAPSSPDVPHPPTREPNDPLAAHAARPAAWPPSRTRIVASVVVSAWLGFSLLTIAVLIAARGCSASIHRGEGPSVHGTRLSTR